jgi:DNA-binding GntR family transcriptional regulator
MGIQRAIARPLPLRQQVYERIRDALRSGRYRAGDRVTEIGLAAELGVSRTPVREALGQLSREGLLVGHARGGFQIPALDARDLDEIFAIRAQLEPFAASAAATRIGAGEIETLEACIAREARAGGDARGRAAFHAANAEFRRILFAASGNARLARLIANFEDHVQYVRARTLDDESVRRVVADGQRRILRALAARSADEAAAAMRHHLEAARRHLLDALERPSRSGLAA